MKADNGYQAIDIEYMARQRAERIQRKIEYSVDTASRATGLQNPQRNILSNFTTPGEDLKQKFLECLFSDGIAAGNSAASARNTCSDTRNLKLGTSTENFPLKKQEISNRNFVSNSGSKVDDKQINMTLNHSVFGNIQLSGYYSPGIGIQLKVDGLRALNQIQLENLERFMSGQLSSQVGVQVEVKIG